MIENQQDDQEELDNNGQEVKVESMNGAEQNDEEEEEYENEDYNQINLMSPKVEEDPFADTDDTKGTQVAGFDYSKYNSSFYNQFEIQKWYISDDMKSGEIPELLLKVQKQFKLQVEQLGVADVKDLKKLPDIKAQQVFLVLVHKDYQDPSELDLQKELMMNVILFLKFVLTRAKEFYDRPYEEQNELWALCAHTSERMLQGSPVIFYEQEEGKCLADVIINTIKSNQTLLQEQFQEKISAYNDKGEREQQDKLKSIEWVVEEAQEDVNQEIFTEHSLHLDEDVQNLVDDTEELALDLNVKTKILQRLIFDLKARHNIDQLIHMTAKPIKCFITVESFKELQTISDQLKYIISTFTDENESLSLISFKNRQALKDKKMEYIKFTIDYTIYSSHFKLKIQVFMHYDQDQYRLNKMHADQLKLCHDEKQRGDFWVYQNQAYNRSTGISKEKEEARKLNKERLAKPPKYIYSQSVNQTQLVSMLILLIWTILTSSFTMYQITFADNQSQVTVAATRVNSESILAKLNTFDEDITTKVADAILLLTSINTNAESSVTKLDANKTAIDSNNTLIVNKTAEIIAKIEDNNTTLNSTISTGFTSLETNLSASETSITNKIDTKSAEVMTTSNNNRDTLSSKLDTIKNEITSDIQTKTSTIQSLIGTMETNVIAAIP